MMIGDASSLANAIGKHLVTSYIPALAAFAAPAWYFGGITAGVTVFAGTAGGLYVAPRVAMSLLANSKAPTDGNPASSGMMMLKLKVSSALLVGHAASSWYAGMSHTVTGVTTAALFAYASSQLDNPENMMKGA